MVYIVCFCRKALSDVGRWQVVQLVDGHVLAIPRSARGSLRITHVQRDVDAGAHRGKARDRDGGQSGLWVHGDVHSGGR